MRVTDHIMIVGGGTSGWLTAAFLAKKLRSNHPQGVRITLVEASDIPTIGVGEATIPSILRTLMQLGIDEARFMQASSATFKQAIKFSNWRLSPEQVPQ